MAATVSANDVKRRTAKLHRRAERWLARHRVSPLDAAFLLSFAGAGIVLATSLLNLGFHLPAGDQVVLFVGLLTGAMVWWQGHLIRRQMQLQTAVGLYAEWNSKAMRQRRRAAWLADKPDPDTIEDVLEFLEKVSAFEKERFISLGLIWETFGWYLWCYYSYCKDAIMEKRCDWTPAKPDPTLYRGLEELYPKLLRMELAERNCSGGNGKELSENDVIRELEETKIKFIECEKSETDE